MADGLVELLVQGVSESLATLGTSNHPKRTRNALLTIFAVSALGLTGWGIWAYNHPDKSKAPTEQKVSASLPQPK